MFENIDTDVQRYLSQIYLTPYVVIPDNIMLMFTNKTKTHMLCRFNNLKFQLQFFSPNYSGFEVRRFRNMEVQVSGI